MLRLVVLAVVLVAAHGMLLGEWENFKMTHKKQYSDREDEFRRFVFEENLKFIQEHNSLKRSYRVGINEYADWTNSEFVDFMNGWVNVTRTSGPAPIHRRGAGELPMTVDWRDKGYVTEVKNQKQCGSCWSFSATGSLEGQHFKQTGDLVSLSEQNLIDCSRPEGNMGCQGGLMDQAFQYIKVNSGIDTEASYPYEAMNGMCRFMPADVGAMDTGYVDVMSKDEMALKDAVANIGPISVAIDASKQSFQLYTEGVYDEPMCSQTVLDHGVLAVGYGTMNMKDYWLVKNSWGETWGMKGYIMMSRNNDNQCGIATSASYPTV